MADDSKFMRRPGVFANEEPGIDRLLVNARAQQGPSVRTQIPTTPPAAVSYPPEIEAGNSQAGGGRGIRNPANVVPEEGSAPAGALRNPTDSFMQGTRAVMRGAGEDMSRLIDKGKYGAAAGTLGRATLAMFPAAAEDILGGPGRVLSAAAPNATDANIGRHMRDAGAAFAGTDPNAPGVPLPQLAGTSTAGAGRGSVNPALVTPPSDALSTPASVRAAQTAAPAAQPQPDLSSGYVSKTIRNPDGSAGKTTTVGRPDPLAHTLSDPGLNYVPIQLPDGTVLDGRTQARMAAQQATARTNEDPIQRGMRQQLEHNQAIMAQAEQMAGSNPDGRSGRIAAYMNQLGGRGSDLVGQNVALRGQDLDAEGKRTAAATAAASAAATKAQQDRVFELDKQRFGAEVAEKNRAASAAAATAVQNSLEAKYRKTDKDGKSVPDHDKIAGFRTAMDETLPAMIKELESTGNPAALAKAKQLSERGAAALEPGDYDDLQYLFDFRDRAEKSAGVLPGSGDFKHSNNLLNYRQKRQGGVQKTMIGGDRVVTPASNTSIRDFQYEDGPANSLLPDWGKTQTLDLTRKLRGFQ